MKLLGVFEDLLSDESGAVTVDWVVLTAAVVILAIGAIAAIDDAVEVLVGQIATAIENVL